MAKGGNDNIGRWHHARVELGKLYREQWGEPRGAQLVEIALFADTDQTGVESIAPATLDLNHSRLGEKDVAKL